MQSSIMRPMPMRPRLPMGGIQLAASSSISQVLADSPCTTECRHDHRSHGHGNSSRHEDMPPPAARSPLKAPPPPPPPPQPAPPVTSSSCNDFAPAPAPTALEQNAFSGLDLFKMEEFSDDLLIQSTEPMAFDESMLTFVTEESTSNSSASTGAGTGTLMVHHNHAVGDLQQDTHSSSATNNTNDSNNNGMDAHVLHRTVLLFPNDANLVHTALVGGPAQAVLTPSPLPHNGYYYPLHMALCQGASLPVLQILVQAGPQVLLQKDGPQGLTPLMFALTHLPNRLDIHELLRKTWPQAAGIPDDIHQELPLHVACRISPNTHHGCVGLIQGLLQDYPAAVLQPNARRLTPLDIIAMQPVTAPHRSVIYQSLQYVAQTTFSSQQSQQQQHPSTTMRGGGGGGGSFGLGALAAPC